jgi:hypothetical protein
MPQTPLGTWTPEQKMTFDHRWTSMDTNTSKVGATLWGTQGGNYVYVSDSDNPLFRNSRVAWLVNPNTGQTIGEGRNFDTGGRGINDIFGNDANSSAQYFTGTGLSSYGANQYGSTLLSAKEVADASSPAPQPMTPTQQAPTPQVQGVQTTAQPYQSPTAPLGSAERTQQLLAAAQQQTGIGTGQQAPIQSGQQAQQMAQSGLLTMPANGSVVDLLNMAGQDSSFAARKQLAQQYGIQGYTGTAAQNQDLAKKYLEAYNAQKGLSVPQNQADARNQLQSYFDGLDQGMGTPDQQFFDILSGQNPIEANLFSQLSALLNTQQNQMSLTQLYQEEAAKLGIPGLQMELADLNRIMDGTEDDIRAEVTAAGGFATESQVQALSAARNKTLLRKAQYLSDVINAKNDYLDNVVALTKADREQMSRDIDQRLGITKMMFDMQTQMQNAARENYNQIIANVGYDGLVNSIKSPQELANVAKALGMSPSTLLQMSAIKTPAQRAMELDELNYQMSVAKFEEDKRQFGMQYALEKQKVAAANAATTVLSPYQQERSTRTLNNIKEIRPNVSSDTVGWGALSAILPSSKARDFAGQVDTLKSSILQSELAAMREASKTGGAVGSMSDKEAALLQSSLGALDTKQSPAAFNKQLNKIEENIWRWNNQMYAIANNVDYMAAKDYYTKQLGSEYAAEQYIYQQFSGQ